jgi:hypothetical protein
MSVTGSACDLSKPWKATVSLTGSGMTITLSYTPKAGGPSGTVDVLVALPAADFEMKGTTTYTVAPVTPAVVGIPTTSTTSPSTTNPLSVPDGALMITYGSITFTINHPGTPQPQLPAAGWGPPLLVPVAKC